MSIKLKNWDLEKPNVTLNLELISEDMAKKYFGPEDPIGKTITMNNDVDLKVSGVFENLPHNSHLQFDFLGPFETFIKYSCWQTM